MKRALFVVSLAGSMLLAMTGVAMASGYNAYEGTSTATNIEGYSPRTAGISIYTTNPHGGYSSTTNKCKTCHAVHQAGPGPSSNPTQVYKLLREASNVNEACNYCHVGAGAHTNRLVYGYANGDPTTAMNGHTIGAAMNNVPDRFSQDAARTDGLVCNTCHSVHGAKTIKFATSSTDPTPVAARILRNDPYGDGTPIADDTTPYANTNLAVSNFCNDCHDMNTTGSNPTNIGKSHPLRAITKGAGTLTPADNIAFTSANSCLSCHAAKGTPHASPSAGTTGYRMLSGTTAGSGDYVDPNKVDDVCIKCHQTGTNYGVGRTF